MNSNIDENRLLELEQKKLDAIHKVLDNYPSIGGFEQSEIAEELLSALSQFDEKVIPKMNENESARVLDQEDGSEGRELEVIGNIYENPGLLK